MPKPVSPESKVGLLMKVYEVVRHPVENIRIFAEVGGASVAATVALLAGPSLVEEAAEEAGVEINLENKAYADCWLEKDLNGNEVLICDPPSGGGGGGGGGGGSPSTTTPSPNPTTPKPAPTTVPTTYETVSVDLDLDGFITNVVIQKRGGTEVGRSPGECQDLLICDFNDTEPAGEGGIGEPGKPIVGTLLQERGLDINNLPPELLPLRPIIDQISTSVNPIRFLDTLNSLFTFTGNVLPDPTATTTTSSTTTTSVESVAPSSIDSTDETSEDAGGVPISQAGTTGNPPVKETTPPDEDELGVLTLVAGGAGLLVAVGLVVFFVRRREDGELEVSPYDVSSKKGRPKGTSTTGPLATPRSRTQL